MATLLFAAAVSSLGCARSESEPEQSTSNGEQPTATGGGGHAEGGGGLGGNGGADGEGGTQGGGGHFDGETVPPPGGGQAPDWWSHDGGSYGTPSSARPMGIVSEPVTYFEGVTDTETGNYFWVFETGPQFTELEVSLFANQVEIDSVHVHDAAGLVFGPAVAPSEVTQDPWWQTWSLEPSHVYVLEVHTVGAGFF